MLEYSSIRPLKKLVCTVTNDQQQDFMWDYHITVFKIPCNSICITSDHRAYKGVKSRLNTRHFDTPIQSPKDLRIGLFYYADLINL